MGRIALLRAGRVSYGILIGVTKCLDLTGLIILAARTIPTFFTLFRAGRGFALRPFAEVMPQCIHIGIRVAVIATGTSMGRIAPFRAGRVSYGSLIVMTKHLNLTGLIMLATRTISALLTLFRTGSSFGFSPFTEVMTQSIYIGIHIAVIAARTGMGRIALFRAGWVSYGSLVVMSKCLNLTGLIILATGAVPAFCTLFCAGGSFRL